MVQYGTTLEGALSIALLGLRACLFGVYFRNRQAPLFLS